MTFKQFIEKVNELQSKGLIDIEAKFDLMDLGQELSVGSFERGLQAGKDIYKS